MSINKRQIHLNTAANEMLDDDAMAFWRAGVKVSQNASEYHSRARKFKPGAFWLQNYWISHPEQMCLGSAS